MGTEASPTTEARDGSCPQLNVSMMWETLSSPLTRRTSLPPPPSTVISPQPFSDQVPSSYGVPDTVTVLLPLNASVIVSVASDPVTQNVAGTLRSSSAWIRGRNRRWPEMRKDRLSHFVTDMLNSFKRMAGPR